MTKEQFEAHQRKHGFAAASFYGVDTTLVKPPKPRMNKTESEYALILEAMKRKGDIVAWKFEGISLSWGAHPKTGKPMWYTLDFLVATHWVRQRSVSNDIEVPAFKLIEVKGGHIFSRDLVRFKGCRAEWGHWFEFEMHQKKEGVWRRIH